jgi:Tfp pilus assembly protein PilN
MSEVKEKKQPSRRQNQTSAAQESQPQPTRKRVPEVPRTAFNFISESWDSRRRRRRSAIIVGGIVGSALVLVVTTGFRAGSAEDGFVKQHEAADAELKQVKADVAKVFGPGGSDVVEHMRARRAQIDGVLAYSLDPEVVEQQLLAAIDPSLNLESITLTADGNALAVAASTTVAPGASTTKPTSTTPTVPTTTLPEQLSLVYNLTIQLRGRSYDDAARLQQALASVPFLSEVTVSPPSGTPETGLSISITARFDPKSMQPERTDFFQKLQGF